jgi:hypothetical protein
MSVLEQLDDRTWLVKRDAESSPEAIIDRFGGGYRLRRFDLRESRRTQHGVYTGLDIAETAWWRIRDQRRR